MAYASTRSEASLAPGTARLVPGDAAVTVHRGSPTAAADAPLRSGDGLTVVRGTAVVETGTGRLFARAGTRINFGDAAPRIMRGDVLALGQQLRVATQPAALVVRGVSRIRQGFSLEVSAYEGSASVQTASAHYGVESLRRLVVVGAAGSASGRISPLALDESDLWDRQHLGVALELDRALSARSRGITLQTEGAGEHIRAQVMAAVAPWSDVAAIGATGAGEAVIAAELARAARLDATDVREMLAWRGDGAAWGLIAYHLGLTSLPAELPGVNETAVGAAITTIAPTVPDGAPKTEPAGAADPAPAPRPGTETTPPATTPTTATPEPVVVNPVGGVAGGVNGLLSGLLEGR